MGAFSSADSVVTCLVAVGPGKDVLATEFSAFADSAADYLA